MRVDEHSRVVRWSVLTALSVSTALIYVVSARANFLYGYGLGQTPQKQELFAWARVAADIWKGFGLIAVVILWRSHKGIALVAIAAWSICFATGVNSAIGVYVQDRSTVTGTREAKYLTYRDTNRALSQIEARLGTLPVRRSVAQIDAAIDAALAKPIIAADRVRGTVGSLSNSCTKLDTRTADGCAHVQALREERAAAADASLLASEASRLRALQQRLRDDGSSLAPDPVGEFWAWATRGLLSVRDVGFGFPLVFALLIEIVSAFGPAVVVAVTAATGGSRHQPAAARMSRVEQAASSLEEWGSVLQWLADRTEPTADPQAVTIEELHADYVLWCRSGAIAASDRAVFAAEFDRVRCKPELARTIRKFGDLYYGLRLVREPRGAAAGNS